jgi:hypothetical protein
LGFAEDLARQWLGWRLRSIFLVYVFLLLRWHGKSSTLVPILGGGNRLNRQGKGIEVGDEPFGDTLGTGLVKQPDGSIKGVQWSFREMEFFVDTNPKRLSFSRSGGSSWSWSALRVGAPRVPLGRDALEPSGFSAPDALDPWLPCPPCSTIPPSSAWSAPWLSEAFFARAALDRTPSRHHSRPATIASRSLSTRSTVVRWRV